MKIGTRHFFAKNDEFPNDYFNSKYFRIGNDERTCLIYHWKGFFMDFQKNDIINYGIIYFDPSLASLKMGTKWECWSLKG